MYTSEKREDSDQEAGRQEDEVSTSEAATNADQGAGELEIPQYNLWIILFMFIWPAAWFMLLIHVVSPLFWKPNTGAGE